MNDSARPALQHSARRPAPFRADDVVRVVAPSGPFDGELLERGLARLGRPHRAADGLAERRQGFLAGSDSERRDELQRALNDPNGAVLLARGGYGIARLVPELRLPERAPWLVGFSDATVLHCWLHAGGQLSIHGPNGTTLANARDEDVTELNRLLAGERPHPVGGLRPLLQAPSPGPASAPSEGSSLVSKPASGAQGSPTAPSWGLCPGSPDTDGGPIGGPIFGGNLTVLFSEAASGRLRVPEGAVLFLEDVTETSYRIDRMLTALAQAGHLGRAAAVLLGDFTDCPSGKFGVDVWDVLAERLFALECPVFCDLPVGHGTRNWPLIIGAEATLDCAQGLLRFD